MNLMLMRTDYGVLQLEIPITEKATSFADVGLVPALSSMS